MTDQATIQYTDPDAQYIANQGRAPALPRAQSAQHGFTDPDAIAIANYKPPAGSLDEYLAGALTTAEPQSLDDYLKANQVAAAPAPIVPAAVQNPSSSILPQPIQDIRNWVSAHGLGGDPMDFYAAAAHNVAKPLHGVSQLIEHGLGGAANLVAPNSSVAQFFNQDNAKNDAALREWESDYQNSVPNNASTYAGALGGNVIPMAAGAGAKLEQIGDYASNLIPRIPQWLRGILSAGVQGGIIGGSQPVTSPSGQTVADLVTGNAGPSYLAQKLNQTGVGALTGGAIKTLGNVGSAFGKAVQPITDPMATVRNYLSNTLGDRAPQVAQAIKNAPTNVPGSVPTAAQVANIPELVMAEKALGNQFPAFRAAQMARMNANNGARLDALQQLAGSPADLDAAITARRAAVQPQIDQLLTNGNPVQVQPVLDALDELKDSSLGVRPTIKGAISDLQQEITSRSNGGMMRPDVLDGLRQNIGDYLRKNAPNGAVGTQEGVAFGPVKDQITQAIERANPGYSDYLANYARLSQPITDARAASGILAVLDHSPLTSAGQPQLTLRGFSSAMRKATSGPYPLSPNAQSTLEGIQNDLQRDTVSNSVRAPGSDTAYNLSANNWLGSKFYGPQFGGNGALPKLVGGALGSFIPGVGTLGGYLGMGKLAEKGAERLGNAVTDVMMNPASMVAQLQKLQQTNPQAASALQRYLTQQGALQAGQKAGQ